MKNILYISIMSLGIMLFIGCNGNSWSKFILIQADSLLQSRPDSTLKLLDSIEKTGNLSEETIYKVENKTVFMATLNVDK